MDAEAAPCLPCNRYALSFCLRDRTEINCPYTFGARFSETLQSFVLYFADERVYPIISICHLQADITE